MKKISLIFTIALLVFSCKNDAKSVDLEENREKSYSSEDGFITLKGDFVFDETQNAAVFDINDEIYGVVINDAMHQLNEKAKALKTNTTDMVTATVRVRKFQKTNAKDTWLNWVEIKDVLNVEAIKNKTDDTITLGK